MSSVKPDNVALEAKKTNNSLTEFKALAENLKIYFGLRGIRTDFSEWVSLNATVLIQRIGYNKKIALFKEDKIILNIGCAGDINNSYINADLFPNIGNIFRIVYGKEKIKSDLFVNISFYDKNLLETADGIVLSHVLEHIPPMFAITALKNCFAYLKQSGYIRVSVPCLEAYEQPQSLFGEFKNRTLAKNNLIYNHNHKFMYDVELLTLIMQEAGLKEVKEVAFSKGLLGESDVLERQAETIYLTGIKP